MHGLVKWLRRCLPSLVEAIFPDQRFLPEAPISQLHTAPSTHPFIECYSVGFARSAKQRNRYPGLSEFHNFTRQRLVQKNPKGIANAEGRFRKRERSKACLFDFDSNNHPPPRTQPRRRSALHGDFSKPTEIISQWLTGILQHFNTRM